MDTCTKPFCDFATFCDPTGEAIFQAELHLRQTADPTSLCCLALFSFPLLHNLTWDQVGIFTTVSILGILVFLERDHHAVAAALLAFMELLPSTLGQIHMRSNRLIGQEG